jgi:hypothetical protein
MSEENTFEPWPLDFVLLKILPDKGTLGGVHWRGRRAKDLKEEIANPNVSSYQIGTRLGILKKSGYVQSFPGMGHGERIWARTEKGVALLGKKEEFLG